METIIKKDGNLEITLKIPLITHRSNPYDENEKSPMDNIVGVIDNHEIGFAHWIDMSYAGKPDQISTLFYIYQGSKKEFKKLCKNLNIELIEYPICIKCFKSIHGVSQWTPEGSICCE